MQENTQMSAKQKKQMAEAEFSRKFGRFWLLYLGLAFTALLSFIGGLMLPFMKQDVNVPLTWGTAMAAIYYAFGFLLIGEGAAYFWTDKVTDSDPDNGKQKLIAGIMIASAVLASMTTALATSYIIAYWVGVFDTFISIPAWAQKYISIGIPVLMVFNVVAGILFRSTSDEAYAERLSKSIISQAKNDMAEAKARAKAEWWQENAPLIAKEMGQIEADDEIAAMKAQIAERRRKRGQRSIASNASTQYAKDTEPVEFSSNGKGKSNGNF